MQVLKELQNLSDAKYKEFSQNIVPNSRILGVKMPVLRKFAKEILRHFDKNKILELIQAKCEFHEEFILKALLINSLKTSENERINLARNFIPEISNWAVCDIFCQKRKNDLNLWHDFVLEFSYAKGEFEKRFFYVNLLVNFVRLQDLQILFEVLNNEKSEKYYIQMAVAWALCEFGVKFENEVYEFLRIYENAKIKNLAIKKICESLRCSDDSKAKFRLLKENR